MFAQAADELITGRADKSLMSRAWAQADGNADAASATYIRLRVERLKKEQEENAPPAQTDDLTLTGIGVVFGIVLIIGLAGSIAVCSNSSKHPAKAAAAVESDGMR